MKYREVTNWKVHRRKKTVALAMLVAGILAGCGNAEDSGNVPTEPPVQTVIIDMQEDESQRTPEPNVTEVPAATSTPEVAATVEPTEAPKPTEEPKVEATAVPTEVPTGNQEQGSYPELKADGRSWGLSYRESGLQPWGNEAPKTLEAYQAYYVGNENDKVIYLTFDCGYENGNTDAILKALENHGVKGTFFVTGAFLEDHADIVNRMIDEGHAVGNHTYNHPKNYR